MEHLIPHFVYYIPLIALLGVSSLACAVYSIVKRSSTAFLWHIAITVTLIVVSLLFSVLPNETGTSFEFGLIKTNRIAIFYVPVVVAFTCLSFVFAAFRFRSRWYSRCKTAEDSILESKTILSSNPYRPPAQ
jgi:hypothetical protein